MMRKIALASLLIAQTGFAFDQKPWFSTPIEMRFEAAYTYSFFSKVNNSLEPLGYTFRENLQVLNLGICPVEIWDIDFEIETAATTAANFYFRSGGAQIRRLWLNDVTGDPLSLLTGLILRGATTTSLSDISSPYAGTFNGELHIAAGKEWAKGSEWLARVWGLFALGQANQGDLWTQWSLFVEGNVQDRHELKVYGKGYFGYGGISTVNLDAFDGWGKIRHQSIDIGVGYRYKMSTWGSLGFDYISRVFAQSYPENVNTFVFSYHLPFSPF